MKLRVNRRVERIIKAEKIQTTSSKSIFINPNATPKQQRTLQWVFKINNPPILVVVVCPVVLVIEGDGAEVETVVESRIPDSSNRSRNCY